MQMSFRMKSLATCYKKYLKLPKCITYYLLIIELNKYELKKMFNI